METATKAARERAKEGFPVRVKKVLANTQYKTPYGFTSGKKKTGFSKATLSAWFRKRGSRFPVTDALLEFARMTGASLDYLVFGEGPEFRGQQVPHADLTEMLQKEVARQLSQSGPLGILIAQQLSDGETILRNAVKKEYELFRVAFIKKHATPAEAESLLGGRRRQ